MKPLDKYYIRDFGPEDAEIILELFRLSFGRNLAKPFWEWRYINGLGKPIVKLMFDGKILIGHYAVIIMPFLHYEEKSSVALSMTTMTHPEYRGQGIFIHLAKQTYEAARDRKILAVYGFPNKNSQKGFFERLNWVRSPVLTEWSLDTSTKGVNLEPGRVKIAKPLFDEQYDKFWQNIKSRFNIIVPRSRSFLQWKLERCPERYLRGEYILFEVREKDELKGYLIFKIYNGEQIIKGHILELLAYDEQIAASLIQAACRFARENEISNINTWLYEEHSFSSRFLNAGFEKSDVNVVWGGRYFLNSNSDVSKSFDRWHIGMLDSDIF